MVKKGGAASSLAPAALVAPLKANKKYAKKMAFLQKKRDAIKASEKGRKLKKIKEKKKSSQSSDGNSKRGGAMKASGSVKKSSKKVTKSFTPKPTRKPTKSMVAKGKKGLAQKAKTACELAGAKRPAGPSSVAAQEEPHCAEKGHDKQLIERIICGEDGKRDIAASSTAVDNLLQYPYLPFLEDYAQHKRSEVVDPDALLEKAHTYFMEYGKRESTLHRAAAKRLKELKEINRRGGDKDGFRYVLPRNVKEAAKLMVEGSDALCSQLASTFGGGEQNDQPPHETSDRPTRRHRRKSRCFSDFYQFQVSKRWTRNAEKFLEKGRAQKSLFVPSRQQRSIRKF